MQGSNESERFLVPEERLQFILPGVHVQRASEQVFGRKDTAFPDKKTLKLSSNFSSGRPVPVTLAVTNRRLFLTTSRIQRVANGRPIPSYEWIFDYDFAIQAIRERRWVQPEATKTALGSTAAFYKSAFTRRADPSTLGSGTPYIALFLDIAPLMDSAIRVGPVAMARYEAGIALRTADIYLLSHDMLNREGWGGRMAAKVAQSKVEKGYHISDFAILYVNPPHGFSPSMVLNLLAPKAGIMGPHIDDLEAKASDLAFAGPPASPPPLSTPTESSIGARVDMHCTSCGAGNLNSSRFCTACGKPLEPPR